MKITYFVSYVAQKTAHEERSGNTELETTLITSIEHIREVEYALAERNNFISVAVINFIELKREDEEADE